MKKFIAIVLSTITVMTSSTSVFADEKDMSMTQIMQIKNVKKNRIYSPTQISLDKTKKIFINGSEIQAKEGTILYENRLFLPVREIGNYLGLDVNYLEKEKVVVLDNGKIKLPVNENKAVVNGEILSVDKENDKVGTIVVNSKTYLPLRFISESLGYNIEYNKENKEIHIDTKKEDLIKLDKNQAVDAYNKIQEFSSNIKNFTLDLDGKVDTLISDGQDKLNMNMKINSISYSDIKDKYAMYTEQNITVEMLGQSETINQKMYYKDGNMYVTQGDLKFKMPLDFDEAMKMSNSQSSINVLAKEIVLGGSVKDLGDGKKQYIFDLDINKGFDTYKQIISGLTDKSLKDSMEIIENINFKDINLVLTVDSKYQPIESKVKLVMEMKQDDVNLKMDFIMDMKYKNIGSTVVKALDEDLSKYKDYNELVKEISTEVTTSK